MCLFHCVIATEFDYRTTTCSELYCKQLIVWTLNMNYDRKKIKQFCVMQTFPNDISRFVTWKSCFTFCMNHITHSHCELRYVWLIVARVNSFKLAWLQIGRLTNKSQRSDSCVIIYPTTISWLSKGVSDLNYVYRHLSFRLRCFTAQHLLAVLRS